MHARQNYPKKMHDNTITHSSELNYCSSLTSPSRPGAVVCTSIACLEGSLLPEGVGTPTFFILRSRGGGGRKHTHLGFRDRNARGAECGGF